MPGNPRCPESSNSRRLMYTEARVIQRTLTGFSLVVLLGTCVLWVYSTERLHVLTDRNAERQLRLKTMSGSLELMRATNVTEFGCPSAIPIGRGVRSYPAEAEGIIGFDLMYHPSRGPNFVGSSTESTCLGFGWDKWDRGSYRLRLPYWPFLVLSGVLPAFSVFRRTRRTAQTRAGLCSACGYDLRASAGRCPECGKPFV